MLRTHPSNRCIIGPNLRQVDINFSIGQLNKRHACIRDGIEQARSRRARDDSITLPIVQPRWRLLEQVSLLQKNRPAIMHPHVPHDPCKKITAVNTRGLNDQCHVPFHTFSLSTARQFIVYISCHLTQTESNGLTTLH